MAHSVGSAICITRVYTIHIYTHTLCLSSLFISFTAWLHSNTHSVMTLIAVAHHCLALQFSGGPGFLMYANFSQGMCNDFKGTNYR